MTLGRLPFTPPRFRPAAAPIAIQQPEWFEASIGARRTFQSMRDVLAYEAAFRTWTPTTPVPEVWFSAAWLGHRDAEAEASARTQGAAQ